MAPLVPKIQDVTMKAWKHRSSGSAVMPMLIRRVLINCLVRQSLADFCFTPAALCQKPTSACGLLDHLVGAQQDRRGNRDADFLSVFTLTTSSNLLGRSTGKSAGLFAPPHSITSSASNCIEFGTVSPSSFAVPRLTTSSYFFGSSNGRSPTFSPLTIAA